MVLDAINQLKLRSTILDGEIVALDAEGIRSEEHTSELQSQSNLVCRLLLEKKKKYTITISKSTMITLVNFIAMSTPFDTYTTTTILFTQIYFYFDSNSFCIHCLSVTLLCAH